MLLRQRLGVFIVLFFLPINGPILRMFMQEIGIPNPFGEFQFLVFSITMFVIGAFMIFTPRISLRSKSVE